MSSEPLSTFAADLPAAIASLQRSTRGARALMSIGLLVLLIGVGVSIYYNVSLSDNLRDARAALAKSEFELRTAQIHLGAANAELGWIRTSYARGETPDAADVRRLDVALNNVRRTERNLRQVTGSIASASDSLQEPGAANGAEVELWFPVVASYSLNAEGLRLAQQRVVKLTAAGQCAQIWQTKISRNYAVVLGGQMTRDRATQLVSTAKRSGLAGDAFPQRDSGWTLMEGSADCSP